MAFIANISDAKLNFVTLEIDGEWIKGICTVEYFGEHWGFLRIEGAVNKFHTDAIWQYSPHAKLEDAVFSDRRMTQSQAVGMLMRRKRPEPQTN